jgi:hypothetical protein
MFLLDFGTLLVPEIARKSAKTTFWVLLDHCWALLDHFWALLGHFRPLLGHFWALLGTLLAALGLLLGALGSLLGALGALLGALGQLLALLGYFGTLLSDLGSIWDGFGVDFRMMFFRSALGLLQETRPAHQRSPTTLAYGFCLNQIRLYKPLCYAYVALFDHNLFTCFSSGLRLNCCRKLVMRTNVRQPPLHTDSV